MSIKYIALATSNYSNSSEILFGNQYFDNREDLIAQINEFVEQHRENGFDIDRQSVDCWTMGKDDLSEGKKDLFISVEIHLIFPAGGQTNNALQ